MPALIDLRRRIRSVKNTQQITQAMKTVSTAKFRKAQRLLLEGRPYWHTFLDLLADVYSWTEGYLHPLLQERSEEKIEGLVITSDKGLAGAFNSNLLEQALSFFEDKANTSEVKLVLAGKKAVSFFKRHAFTVERAYEDNVEKLASEEIREIAQFLIRLYVFQRVDAVYVAYNEFKSILAPRVTIAKLLPLIPAKEEGEERVLVPGWEPEVVSILNLLLPLYVESQVYHYFRESSTAEHAARMMAMDNASKNAEELIEDLTLVLNKIRQASITKELLEIMTAVEALAKK
ncbi:MAG: ATP synthase F1 subunit gamma [Candidatus Aminicenantes bacterium]|nr:ATP synthase F1 subunit gamma [Candidatus Aminicenantes bacterium]